MRQHRFFYFGLLLISTLAYGIADPGARTLASLGRTHCANAMIPQRYLPLGSGLYLTSVEIQLPRTEVRGIKAFVKVIFNDGILLDRFVIVEREKRGEFIRFPSFPSPNGRSPIVIAGTTSNSVRRVIEEEITAHYRAAIENRRLPENDQATYARPENMVTEFDASLFSREASHSFLANARLNLNGLVWIDGIRVFRKPNAEGVFIAMPNEQRRVDGHVARYSILQLWGDHHLNALRVIEEKLK